MVYNEPTIYGKESFNLVDIKDLTTDWINITSEFSLFHSQVYKTNNTLGTIDDLNILFSKKLKIVYFDCSQAVRILHDTELTTTGWSTVLKYNGTKFNVPPNGGRFSINTMISPNGINRGVPLFQMARSSSSINGLCRFNYGRDDVYASDYGLSLRAFILDPNSNENFGVLIGQCVFSVEPN